MNNHQISVEEIKHDLSTFLQRLEAGESLVITKSGKPLAKIKPVATQPSKRRPFGLCQGDFIVPDDFDAPLPESIIKDFEGK
jgi:prevent-host-death family protein